MEIEIDYPAFAHETSRLLQFFGPDCSVRPGCINSSLIRRIKWQYRLAIAVAESFDRVRMPIPPPIGYPLVFPGAHLISHIPIAEHVPSMVEDYVENAINALLVCCVDQAA